MNIMTLQTTQMMARIGKVAPRLPMLCFMAPRITGARAPTAKPVIIIALEQEACVLLQCGKVFRVHLGEDGIGETPSLLT